MMCFNKMTAFALLMMLFVGAGAAPLRAQGTKDEVKKLRKEVTQLREELDAAVREIHALKEAMKTGNPAPVKSQLYGGQPVAYWQAQLNDADEKVRVEAVKAIAALARKDNKLIPTLIDLLKDENYSIAELASKQLSAFGAEVLPNLLEIAKDKTQPTARRNAIVAIGGMGAKAKSAVPVLTKALDDKSDVALVRSTVDALAMIGPDAKESIPALVHALGASLEPERFGTNAGSLSYRILGTLCKLDPALQNELTPPPDFVFGGGFGKGGGKGGGNSISPSPEVRQAWQQVHETLVKKYIK